MTARDTSAPHSQVVSAGGRSDVLAQSDSSLPSTNGSSYSSSLSIHPQVVARYGEQLSSDIKPAYEDIVFDHLDTYKPFRLWQLNYYVTRGVNGGYEEEALDTHMMSRFQDERLKADRLTSALVSISFPGYSQATYAAAKLGFSIRRKQAFRDGNHRTALLAIIHLLAQYGLKLDDKANIVYMYKLLSARHLFVSRREPLRIIENCLPILQGAEEAWEIALGELQAYLHKHVTRFPEGSMDLRHKADAIRALPIRLSDALWRSDQMACSSLTDAQTFYRQLDGRDRLDLISHVPLLHLGRPGRMNGRPLADSWRLSKRCKQFQPIR